MHPSSKCRRYASRRLLSIAILLTIALPILHPAPIGAFDPLSPPDVTARAVFSIDVTANVVLYQKNADEPLPPASTTKIATALVVLERVADLNEPIEITTADMVDQENESHMGVEVGEIWTVEDLLYGLMIPSGNDAALALARRVGGQINADDPVGAFVGEMNAVAEAMGLQQTQFTNPVGLADDPDHYTSARDLAALAARLMEYDLIRQIVREKSFTVTSDGPEPRELPLVSTNKLLGRFDIHGLKTGSTGIAGGCLVIANWAGDNNRVITVALGSAIDYSTRNPETGELDVDQRWADMESMLGAMADDYRWVAPSEADQVPGLHEELAAWQVELSNPAAIVLPASGDGEVAYQLRLGPPGEPESQVGSVLFFVGSEQIAELPVFQSAVAQATDDDQG
ncbi:MAG: D-alanyl-D-alanine carboxypeptidase family protein [Thermomicrobiales bacterium]